jgi:hypothetical protein
LIVCSYLRADERVTRMFTKNWLADDYIQLKYNDNQ